MTYSQFANPNATNSELDAKKIVKNVQSKSITSQLSDNAIYQILEIIASEIDNIDDKELSIILED